MTRHGVTSGIRRTIFPSGSASGGRSRPRRHGQCPAANEKREWQFHERTAQSRGVRRTALIDWGSSSSSRASRYGSYRREQAAWGTSGSGTASPVPLYSGRWRLDGRAAPPGTAGTLRISALSLLCMLILGLTTALLRLSVSFTARALAWAIWSSSGTHRSSSRSSLFISWWHRSSTSAPSPRRPGAQPLRRGLRRGDPPGGIVSIHRGQWRPPQPGARTFDTYRSVILPQAIHRVLPPLAGQRSRSSRTPRW